MISVKDKNEQRLVRHKRVRRTLSGTAEKPRLCVYRSLTKIYAQIIDDETGRTLVSASCLDKDIAEKAKDLTKTEQTKLVGESIAKKALANKIDTVVFDRGGYVYKGRVQALADSARNAGLKF